MLKNYLVTIARNWRTRKMYSSIAWLSLAIGLATAALVLLYVRYEKSYDTMHRDPENTYRIIARYNDETFPVISLHYRNLLSTIPHIKKTVGFVTGRPSFASYQDKKFAAQAIITDAGNTFFDIFSYEFLEGSRQTSFNDPNTVILTASAAQKYFGLSDPMNRIIRYDTFDLRVSGVIKEVPANSHFTFDMLIFRKKFDPAWVWGNYTYCLLDENKNLKSLVAQLNGLPPARNQFERMQNFELQALRDIHLSSHLVYELKPNSHYKYLWIFSAIGLLILAVACFNYLSLSFVMFANRGKEIAVRKVAGAERKDIAFQFLSESTLTALLCLPVVIALIYWGLPAFNRFMNVSISAAFLFSPAMVGYFILLTAGIGMLVGSYPAILLSRFHPVALLQNLTLMFNRSFTIRRVAVTIQFVFIFVVAIFAFFINRQLQYLQQVDLGFQKDGIIKIKTAWVLGKYDNYVRLKSRLLSQRGILRVAQGRAPGEEDYPITYSAEGHDGIFKDALSFRTDHDYFKILEIEGLAGNYFKERQHPHATFLVSETAAKNLGYADPIGKQIIISPGPHQRVVKIGGVFKDFNFFSLRRKPVPMFISAQNTTSDVEENILIKVDVRQTRAAFAAIEKAWDEIAPGTPVSYAFMNEELQRFYELDQKVSLLSARLSLLAISLGVIGLIGLSAYSTVLRRKEIGIRKVLGASVINIAALLSKDFLKLVLLAIVIASPFASWSIHQWLQQYAYRTEINWWVFAAIGLLTVLISLITVSFLAIRAAAASPVKNLRTE